MRIIHLTVVLFLLAVVTGASAMKIAATEARIKTVGNAMPPDQTHTEAGWNIWSNGEVGDYVKIAQAGTYRIVVRAWGSPLGGVWPLVALNVDGNAGKPVTVGQKESADYQFTADFTTGLHRITVAFLNDAVSDKEDRNVYVHSLEIQAPAGGAEPALGTTEEWTAQGLRREEQTIAAAAAAIERIRKSDGVVSVVDAKGKPVAGAKVTVELVRHEFLFGCNIYMFDHFRTDKENESYKQRFAELFNYATVGFYWRWYEPQRGQPNYPYTDKVVAWCREHNIRMKGHPLLWAEENGVPLWSSGQPSPDIQRARVTEIMHRYGDRISNWEVVNEPSHLSGLRIDEPYRWARELDSKAYLIVNDYAVLADGFPPFFALLEKAKAAGVPFDGIGIQAHEPRTMRFPLDRVQATLDKYGTLGKDLHITEFTPASSGDPITGSPVTGKWDEQAQADYAVKFYRVCFAHPSVVAITWWDLCDNGAWLPGGGMLRRDLSPKPAYTALRNLIGEEWHTRTEGVTDKTGRLKFRGFHGAYAVTVTGGGQTVTGAFSLARATNGAPTLTVLKLTKPDAR